MSQFFVFHLWPTSPWHLGEAGVELVESGERLHADTLYSALCHAWALLGRLTAGDKQPAQDPLPFSIDDPPFTISSAFPLVKAHDGKCLYFWPTPVVDVETLGDFLEKAMAPEDKELVETAKEGRIKPQDKLLKKCRYLSNDLWQKLVQGMPVEGATDYVQYRSGAAFWMTKAESEVFGQVAQRDRIFFSGQNSLTPRVELDRITTQGNLYSVGRLFVVPNAGFYFLLEGESEHAQLVQQALEILQDEGIGGERTYGFGCFHLECPTLLPTGFTDGQSHCYCLLSLCAPQPGEIHSLLGGSTARYNILKRTGIIQSPVRKDIPRKTVRMLAEGSLFGQRPQGRVLDVKPTHGKPMIGHPVVRYGKAFAVKGVFGLKGEAEFSQSQS